MKRIPRHLKANLAGRPDDARLRALLDEWQPTASDVAPGFEQRLQRRIAVALATPPGGWVRGWWRAISAGVIAGPWASPKAPLAGAVASLAIVLAAGTLLHFEGSAPQPAPQPAAVMVAQTDPVVRDLQTLNTERTSLESLDLLNGGGADERP